MGGRFYFAKNSVMPSPLGGRAVRDILGFPWGRAVRDAKRLMEFFFVGGTPTISQAKPKNILNVSA